MIVYVYVLVGIYICDNVCTWVCTEYVHVHVLVGIAQYMYMYV